MVINDFTLKINILRLEKLGYTDFEHFCVSSKRNDAPLYYFKYIFDGVSFYFHHYCKDFPEVHENFFINHASRFTEYYEEEKPSYDNFAFYVQQQVIDKICFEAKTNMGFPTSRLETFFKKAYKDHGCLKDFLKHIDDYDLVSLLKPE